jgi:hypothetical protein
MFYVALFVKPVTDTVCIGLAWLLGSISIAREQKG